MGEYQKLIIHRKLKVSTSVIFSHPEIQYIPAKASKFCQKHFIKQMIPAPCTNRLIRGGWCVGSQPAILVGAWIARSVAEWSVRTVRIDRQSCMRSSHAPRTRDPEPHVRENRKTESRKTDSGTVCRKTPSPAGRTVEARTTAPLLRALGIKRSESGIKR